MKCCSMQSVHIKYPHCLSNIVAFFHPFWAGPSHQSRFRVARSNSQAVQILLMNGTVAKTKKTNPTAVIITSKSPLRHGIQPNHLYRNLVAMCPLETGKAFGTDLTIAGWHHSAANQSVRFHTRLFTREMRAAIGGPFCSGNTWAPLDAHLWQFLAAMKLKQSQLPTKLCGAQSGKCT